MLVQSDAEVPEAFNIIKYNGKLVGVHLGYQVLVLGEQLVRVVVAVEHRLLVTVLLRETL